MTAPAAVFVPPCQAGYRCGEHDGPHNPLHRDSCPLSKQSGERRLDRIDTLTPAEMRGALERLSGWTPLGTDWALHVAETLRRRRPAGVTR